MRTLKDSWFMLHGEIRGDKWKLIYTFLFSVLLMSYFGFFIGLLLNESLGKSGRNVIVDFMLLFMVPILGFTYSRRSFKYWSEDPYTKMLAYLRSLPIPLPVIICKRKLQSLFSFSFNGILFFGLMYLMGSDLRIHMSLLPYIVFALTWIGFGLMMTGVYIFIEFLYSGKVYCGVTFLIMLGSAGIAALVNLSGGSLLFYSVSCSKNYEFLSPLMWGTLITGALSVQMFSSWTIHRLKKRDLV